ncbi:unnamed protein product [Citrullus colocynthis]|uniref:Glycosyl hydrolase family 32 N-terminal domain-containing protein n=1 Tax=Citrullus colocynthis TaxID=252529 RepID=A0ABP0XR40_9ROSI
MDFCNFKLVTMFTELTLLTLFHMSNDIQGNLSSVLPIQPKRSDLGQHCLGPLHINGPDQLETHDHAIYPSQPSDINGCWSGSATILPDDKPTILYTGINPKNQQVQNLAVPKNLSDPYLREWVKSPKNPLMAPTSQNHINSSSSRDPTTANGEWSSGAKLMSVDSP